MKKYRNTIEFEVCGPYALFSDPVMRVGGEKTSYHIPTRNYRKHLLEANDHVDHRCCTCYELYSN